MPPESPTPGGASGEECTESTATRRTSEPPDADAWPFVCGTRNPLARSLAPRTRDEAPGADELSTGIAMLSAQARTGHAPAGTGGASGRGGGLPGRLGLRRGGRGLAAGPERGVDVDEHLLLALGQVGVAQDGDDQVGIFGVLVEDARLDVERLGADPQRLGDVLEDLGRRLAQPALDLGQVRVRHPGLLGQVAQGQLSLAPLLADVAADAEDGTGRVELLDALAHRGDHSLPSGRHGTSGD